MECFKCKEGIEPDEFFCSSCQTQLQCLHCKKTFRKVSKYCPKCSEPTGKAVRLDEENNAQKEPRETKEDEIVKNDLTVKRTDEKTEETEKEGDEEDNGTVGHPQRDNIPDVDINDSDILEKDTPQTGKAASDKEDVKNDNVSGDSIRSDINNGDNSSVKVDERKISEKDSPQTEKENKNKETEAETGNHKKQQRDTTEKKNENDSKLSTQEPTQTTVVHVKAPEGGNSDSGKHDEKPLQNDPGHFNDWQDQAKCKRITFEILLHPNFKIDKNELRIQLQCFGEWKGRQLQMNIDRQESHTWEDCKFEKIRGHVYVPKFWMDSPAGFHYKYVIIKRKKKKKIIEYWYNDCRSLLKIDTADTDDIVILDGAVCRKKFFQFASTVQLIQEQSARCLCEIYFTSILPEKGKEYHAQNVCSEFIKMVGALETTYFNPANLEVTKLLETFLVTRINQLVAGDGVDAALIIQFVLVLMVIIKTFKCNLPAKERRQLADLTLPKDEENSFTVSTIDAGQAHASVLYFCNLFDDGSNIGDASWLLCLPLLHFTSGIAPKTVVQFEPDKKDFWGDDKIEEMIVKLLRKEKQFVAIEEIWKTLPDYFVFDGLLERTLTTCLLPAQLANVILEDRIRPELAVMAIGRFINIYNHQEIVKTFASCMKTLIETLKTQQKQLELICRNREQLNSSTVQRDTTVMLKATHYLFKHSVNTYEAFVEFHSDIVLLHVQSISNREYVVGMSGQGFKIAFSDKMEVCKGTLTGITHRIRNRFEDVAKVLSKLLDVTVLVEDSVIKDWVQHGFHLLHDVMHKLHTRKILEVFCECKNDGWLPDVAKLVEEKLQMCLHDIYDQDYNQQEHPHDFFWHSGEKFGKLYSFVLLERCRGEVDQLSVLLNWPTILPALKRRGKQQDELENLTKDARTCIDVLWNHLQSLLSSLETDHILVGDLNRVSERRMLLQIMLRETGYEDKYLKILDNCLKVVKKFQTRARYLTQLLEKCDDGIVDTQELVEEIEKSSAIQTVSIKEIRNSISEIVFGSKDYDSELANFVHGMKSVIVRRLWECQWEKVRDEFLNSRENIDVKLPIIDMLSKVWKPVYSDWTNFGERVKKGNITITEIVQHMGWKEQPTATGPEFTEELRKEFTLIGREIGNDLSFVEQRISQIVKASEIKQNTELAIAILKMIKTYNLTGDYSYLEDIVSSGQDDFEISRINEKLRNVATMFDGISSTTREGILIFKKCHRLIEWVQTSMSDGDADVKAFVDVALTKVEEAIEIGKIQCFHSAILGYTPLVFMPKDVTCEDLINRIRHLEEAVQVNPQLPKNLKETKPYLDWLQEVNKSTSGEETSLHQAETLTIEGICIIGRFDLNIEPMLLELPDIVGIKANNEDYNLENLVDVQSKLVLRGGESDFARDTNDVEGENTTIERFTTVFECLRRLGLAYIKLLRSGCILFQRMRFEFKCTGVPVCRICFNLSGAEYVLDVETDSDSDIDNAPNDVQHYMTEMSKFLEGCHREWSKNIEKARDSFYYLNYFTVHQIVHLQIALGQMKAKEEESVQNDVYHILSMVKRNAQIFDVKDAMSVLDDNAGEFYHPKSMDDLVWNFGRQKRESKPFDTAMECLQNTWDEFRDQDNLMINNYLNFRELGDFLTTLNSKRDLNCSVQRKLHRPLDSVNPNLLVCEEGEVLSTVLTLYLQGEMQALPQWDEILMCTSQTTSDQFEAFIKRALTEKDSQEKKIYTIINADLLNYNVSREAEECLNRHVNDIHTDFRLVMVCSKSNQSKSLLIGAWGCYSRPFIPINVQGISAMVQSLLRPKTSEGITYESKESNVRIVTSSKAGMGKSLYVQQQKEITGHKYGGGHISFALTDKEVNVDEIMRILQENIISPEDENPRVIHVDISPEVKEGVDYLLFNLLVTGCLSSSTGAVWRKRDIDVYIVECMESSIVGSDRKKNSVHEILKILPKVECLSPQHCYQKSDLEEADQENSKQLGFNISEYETPVFQRPYKYLRSMGNEKMAHTQTNQRNCLQVLLGNCCINDPSWAELKQFVLFLDRQILDFESSVYCSELLSDTLPGFSRFVLRFLQRMSQDFATRSLDTEDSRDDKQENQNDIKRFQMRRTWESSPHPYLFFNPDHHSMTFLGFNIPPDTLDLMDDRCQIVLEEKIMRKDLWDSLEKNGVPIREEVASLSRKELIQKLLTVMGVEAKGFVDPDETYELTSDNVKKMMAIYMRFRCGIPVIIMGETGCGKTTLVKFLCSIQCPPEQGIKNMILMKVHGGTTKRDIRQYVAMANSKAYDNKKTYGDSLYTVLFFDEANTTEAIEFIKGIICDNVMDGKKLILCPNLKFIAACNPYRKHSEQMIDRLQNAGLGYHVHSDRTDDTLGRIPMRHLVYRVQPLPESMLPLVWDFGQLDNRMEEQYIKKMVAQRDQTKITNTLVALRGITTRRARNEEDAVLTTILQQCQIFMRNQHDECSFVSLRDVERSLRVMEWFIEQDYLHNNQENVISKSTRSLILALSVCYQASLKNKEAFRQHIVPYFIAPFNLPGGTSVFAEQIHRCQQIMLDNIKLEANIARNTALSENVFMMIVCIELRIPLFIVGKPGSSKSLAKTVVSNAMQGPFSSKDIFKTLKQTQMISYQCSPLSTAEGIVKTFSQAASLQQNKDLTKFASVVVLDEIGLAEDSPKMPLKTLHPLLEDGSVNDDIEIDKAKDVHKKVSFIGLSNWALDPAKMNRGILVQREVPDSGELHAIAAGICSENQKVIGVLQPLIPAISNAYMKLVEDTEVTREFSGLRDFYGLCKMIAGFAKKDKKMPTWHQLLHAIKRNFGGLDSIDPVEIFKEMLPEGITSQKPKHSDPDCSLLGVIKAGLNIAITDETINLETRYLLLITENYALLPLLNQQLTLSDARYKLITIFGSSFPEDQEYIQICRNINRIKMCMETGQMVLLLNLENLYESLYDVLNQHYITLNGEKYVDLGLGTHRMKCKVDKKFRLIVIAEKDIVYKEFPTPLINRLEKHFLRVSTMLDQEQQEKADELKEWVSKFCTSRNTNQRTTEGDVFIGYNTDVTAMVILKDSETQNPESNETDDNLSDAKQILLMCVTPDSVVRLKISNLSQHSHRLQREYFENQKHGSIAEFLESIDFTLQEIPFLFQVTTYSKLLSKVDENQIAKELQLHDNQFQVLHLPAFDTEQEFCRAVSDFLQKNSTELSLKVLIVQCNYEDRKSNLIACARYRLHEEVQNATLAGKLCVLFIIQIPHIAGGCFTGYQTGQWTSVHIDDIRVETNPIDVLSIMNVSLTELLRSAYELTYNVKTLEPGTIQPTIFTDITDVLYNCIHQSLVKVVDTDTQSNRALNRIQIFLYLFRQQIENDEAKEMIQGLVACILKLSKERDENSHVPPKSIVDHAAMIENVRRAGTFRNSLIRSYYLQISQVLAGLTAFIDTNRNMGTFDMENISWKRRFWVNVMKKPEALHLTFTAIREQGVNSLQQFETKSTGFKGQPFGAVFPFSWIIFHHVEQIRSQPIQTENRVERIVAILSRNEQILELLVANTIDSTTEAFMAYLSDFIYMKCSCKDKDIHEVLCEEYMVVLRNSGLQLDNGNVVEAIVLLHEISGTLDDRIYKLYLISQQWPGCGQHILDNLQKNYKDRPEPLFDIVGITELIMRTSSMRKNPRNWLQNVYSVMHIVEATLKENITEEKVGRRYMTITNSCRLGWNKVLVQKFLLEDVVLKTQNGVGLLQKINLKEKLDFRSKETLESIENIVETIMKHSERDKQKVEEACTTFYKNVISKLCFMEDNSPTEEVFEYLMRFITNEKRHGDKGGIAVRAHFIQLLLKTGRKDLKENLQAFIKRTKDTMKSTSIEKSDRKRAKKDFYFMMIKCIQDHLANSAIMSDGTDIQIAIESFQLSEGVKTSNSLDFNQIDCIARNRFALQVTAQYLHKCFSERSVRLSKQIENLFDLAGQCLKTDGLLKRKYLLDEIVKSFGKGSYQDIMANTKTHVQWLGKEYKEIPECDDRYLVCGDMYQRMCKDLEVLVENDDPDLAINLAWKFEVVNTEAVCGLLAIHRKITLTYIHEKENGGLSDRENVRALVENSFGKNVPILNFKIADNLQNQGIKCLLVHLYAVLSMETVSPSLVEPLRNLAFAPINMRDSFLPTMPEEPTYEDIMNLLRKEPHENATVYECPNGHPYTIGNCGRPRTEANCPECNEMIGGLDYKINARNKLTDNSSIEKNRNKGQGHILGVPEKRSPKAPPERHLTAAATAILRLFVHAALLLGANRDLRNTTTIVRPPVLEKDLSTFFHSHLLKDLECLKSLLKRNEDDVMIFLHYLLVVVANANETVRITQNNKILKTSNDRRDWEETFAKYVLNDNIKKYQNILNDLKAKHFSSKDETPEVQSSSFVWKPHTRVTFEDVVAEFQNSPDKDSWPFLASFIKKEKLLQLVKHLPAVMQLQNTLLSKCKRKLEKEEVEKTSIQDFLAGNFKGSEVNALNDLVEKYSQAWNDANVHLKNYAFTVQKRDLPVRIVFPEKFRQLQITPKSKLLMFLPGLSKEGLCSYVLAEFLIRTQNEFLEQFCGIHEISFEKVPIVKPFEVSSYQIISVDTNTDLQSLALANYEHRTDVNGGEIISFDFGGVERQLKDNFICGKSKIHGKIETMAYRSEMSITWSYETLCDKLKQVPLTQSAKKRIIGDFHSVPDLHDCLDNLNLAIGFLCCLDLQEQMEDSVVKLLKRLEIQRPGLGDQASQICKNKHLLSLWLTLAMEKCRRMSFDKQDPFPEVDDRYKMEMKDKNLRSVFNKYMKKSQRAKLIAVAETLFECIVFRLSVDDNDEDRFDYSKHSIRETLVGHISVHFFDEETAIQENASLITEEDIALFPAEIMGEHSIPIWQCLMQACH